jgi:excinuclease UvrABC ATPase subunit
VAVCRDGAKTVLVASHDEGVLAAADRVVDMTAINRADATHRAA